MLALVSAFLAVSCATKAPEQETAVPGTDEPPTAPASHTPAASVAVQTMAAREFPPVTGPPGRLVLLPVPRMVKQTGTVHAIPGGGPQMRLDGALAGTRVREELLAALEGVRAAGPTAGGGPVVSVAVDPAAMPHPQGYVLDVGADGISIVAHDAPGAFYAVMTLRQVARQYAGLGRLPGLHAEDWPDFPHRGVMLDVARCKVPEMATLYRLVDLLAEWKCNELQLYTEHTFAYRGHHTVWEDASPMTPVQARALDAYCRDRFIELVPNQNSFGHMGRWLQKPAYAHLAETPGGGDLCPVDPGSIALLESMYAHLLPNFSSGQFNVGCDETWSLGKGRSKEACEERGVGRVYFEFLMKIRGLCREHGKRMQFWGDIIMQHPELIPEIPDDVIAMEWGYEAAHPFKEHGEKFAASGIPFYVVPGTSTWNSLVGRTDNAMANLLNAAENGLANGAVGYLITDWGDGGHWQFQPASYLGFAYGAAVSWALDANRGLDVPEAVDVHAFEDRAGVMGKLAHDLGNAYQVSGYIPGNSSVFYALLAHKVEGMTPRELRAEDLERTIAYIDKVMARLPEQNMRCTDAALVAEEFAWSAALMKFACRLGIARIGNSRKGTSELGPEAKAALSAELRPLIPAYRQLWLSRNRGGGLKESAGHFEALLEKLTVSGN